MATAPQILPNQKTTVPCTADPVLPHEDRGQFKTLLAHYRSDFKPETAHQEFLVSQMAGARWKLDRLERIEIVLLTPLIDPNDPETSDAMIAQSFTDQATTAALARIDRSRAALERTYHRCARELRASQKFQNEAKSEQLAEKKFQKLVVRMMDAPPPGYICEPRLVPVDPNDES